MRHHWFTASDGRPPDLMLSIQEQALLSLSDCDREAFWLKLFVGILRRWTLKTLKEVTPILDPRAPISVYDELVFKAFEDPYLGFMRQFTPMSGFFTLKAKQELNEGIPLSKDVVQRIEDVHQCVHRLITPQFPERYAQFLTCSEPFFKAEIPKIKSSPYRVDVQLALLASGEEEMANALGTLNENKESKDSNSKSDQSALLRTLATRVFPPTILPRRESGFSNGIQALLSPVLPPPKIRLILVYHFDVVIANQVTSDVLSKVDYEGKLVYSVWFRDGKHRVLCKDIPVRDKSLKFFDGVAAFERLKKEFPALSEEDQNQMTSTEEDEAQSEDTASDHDVIIR